MRGPGQIMVGDNEQSRDSRKKKEIKWRTEIGNVPLWWYYYIDV